MSQRKFILELLDEFECSHLSSVVSPLDLTTKVLPSEGAHVTDPALYRKLVGKLKFLTNTRPNLSFVVHHLSQFMSDPRLPLRNAAIHVLRYLKFDPNIGFF